MNISEVSIGDIVSVNGRPIHVTLAVLNHWSDNIEPIPITKELLEKNGFVRDNRFGEEYNKGINNRVYIHIDRYFMFTDNEWSVTTKTENEHTLAHCELTYLHELQHLLRISKIDFDWEL